MEIDEGSCFSQALDVTDRVSASGRQGATTSILTKAMPSRPAERDHRADPARGNTLAAAGPVADRCRWSLAWSAAAS